MDYSICAIAIAIAVFTNGCVPIPIHKTFTHKPTLARNVSFISKGITTEAELFQRLGQPDITAEGATSRVTLNNPLERYWSDYWKAAADWRALFPYSSLSERHVAHLYLEIESDVLILANVVGVGLAHVRATIRRNKLLVFVNRRTGIVEHFFYTEEFVTR